MDEREKEWVREFQRRKLPRDKMEETLIPEGYTEKQISEFLSYYDKLNERNEIKPPKGKKQDKKFFDKVFNKEKMKKTNKVAVIYLRENGLIDFKEVESKDGEFFVEGNKYHEDEDCVYTTQKDRIPTMIVREWDIIPLGTKRWYDVEGDDEKMRRKFAQLETHVLRGIKNFELYKSLNMGSGINMNAKQLIMWGLVILVGGVVLINYIH